MGVVADISRPLRTGRAPALVLLAGLLLAGSQSGVTAAAATTDEAAFIDAINGVRTGLGLGELQHHDELADAARDHAAKMADAGEIFHADPISAGLTAEWQKLGENVGVGAGVRVLMDAFIASPGHYANIIDPGFTHVGVGVVWVGDALYTTHRFLQPPEPAGTESPPAPTTTAEPTTTAQPTTSAEPTTTEEPTVDPSPVETTSHERVIALFGLLDDVG